MINLSVIAIGFAFLIAGYIVFTVAYGMASSLRLNPFQIVSSLFTAVLSITLLLIAFFLILVGSGVFLP